MTNTTEQLQPNEATQPTDAAKPLESRDPVMGVTSYDRVVSFLLTMLFTLGGVSAGLGMIWASNHVAKPTPPPAHVELTDVTEFAEDFGGGDLKGTLEGGPVEIAGPESADPANDDSDRPSADSIALEATISLLAERVSEATEMAELLFVDAPAGLSRGSRGKHKTPVVGIGGKGQGGAPASERWEIVFEKGLTEAEYARQLDFLIVELGVVVDGKLYRVSHFSSSKPVVRVTEPRATEHEVMFVWRDERRRQVDIGLLRRASEVSVADNAVVLHFYPSATALKPLRLERDYAIDHGRLDLHVVAKTRFLVKKADAGYEFEIMNQRYFARYEGEAKL